MKVTNDQRRRAERRAGSWHGRYKSGRFARWVDCGVIDVSMGGAAIEVAEPDRVRLGRLLLELDPLGDGNERVVIVRAEVRNASVLPERGWRVGVEFADMNDATQSALQRMLDLYST